MGSTAMVGLGLALARPDRRVAVITGDGDVLMALGSLATIGVKQPDNLAIVCLDNRHYSATGMQPSATAAGIDLAGTARVVPVPPGRAGLGGRQRGRDARIAAHGTRPDLHPCAGRGRRPAARHPEPRRLRHQAALHAGVGEAGLTAQARHPLVPAKAGTRDKKKDFWIPACAGMSGGGSQSDRDMHESVQSAPAFAPETLTTLAHFSVSSAISLPKSAGGAGQRRAAHVGQPRLDLRIGEAGIDLLVEPIDDLGRRVLGRANAVPRARLVARHELAHRRNVRQRLRARRGGHRQRAQLAGS